MSIPHTLSSGGPVSHQSCPTFIVIVHHCVWKMGKMGEGIIIVIHPPHPCIVVGHHMRVRASASAFGANSLGGKVSTRELLSNHPSSMSSHHQLIIIIWWGCRCCCYCWSSLTVLIALLLSGKGLVDVISPLAILRRSTLIRHFTSADIYLEHTTIPLYLMVILRQAL